MGCATFWAFFSQTHLVTLPTAHIITSCENKNWSLFGFSWSNCSWFKYICENWQQFAREPFIFTNKEVTNKHANRQSDAKIVTYEYDAFIYNQSDAILTSLRIQNVSVCACNDDLCRVKMKFKRWNWSSDLNEVFECNKNVFGAMWVE
jgi:hypothetical protein